METIQPDLPGLPVENPDQNPDQGDASATTPSTTFPIYQDGLGRPVMLAEDDTQRTQWERWRTRVVSNLQEALYKRYLGTKSWRELRQRVLKRDKHACQLCKQAPATMVHHLTYERVYCESPFDLISLCQQCHVVIHAAIVIKTDVTIAKEEEE